MRASLAIFFNAILIFCIFATTDAHSADRFSVSDDCALRFTRQGTDRATLQSDVHLHWLDYSIVAANPVVREEDHSVEGKDKIIIYFHGVPEDFKEARLAPGTLMYYFPHHRSLSAYYVHGEELRNSLLNFQVLTSAPGYFWDTDDARRWRQHHYPNLTGIVLSHVDKKIDLRWGRPMLVQIPSEMNVVQLPKEGQVLVPGTAGQFVLPVNLRELTDHEWQQLQDTQKRNQIRISVDYRSSGH